MRVLGIDAIRYRALLSALDLRVAPQLAADMDEARPPQFADYPALERRALALNDLNSAEAKAGLVERPGGVD